MTRRRAACSRKRAEDSTQRRTKRTRQSRACVSRTSSSTCAISKPPMSWRPPRSRRSGRSETSTGASALACALGFAALGLGRRSEAREVFAESLDLVLAADTRSGMPSRTRSQESRSQRTRRTRDRPRGSKAQSTSWTSPHPQPAIPSARAIPRAAAHRRPRRGRIRERAGTRRRHGHRRRDRPGANARQPGEPRSGRRVLKDRGDWVCGFAISRSLSRRSRRRGSAATSERGPGGSHRGREAPVGGRCGTLAQRSVSPLAGPLTFGAST